MSKIAAQKEGLLVVDHGSRRAAANQRLHEIAAQLALHPSIIKQGQVVMGAHMELGEPTISTALDQLQAAGITQVTVVPLMVSPGRHVMEDIPDMLKQYAASNSHLELRYCEPLSEHSLFFDLLIQSAEKSGSLIEKEGQSSNVTEGQST